MIWKLESTRFGSDYHKIVKAYPTLKKYGAYRDEDNEASIKVSTLETVVNIYNDVHSLDDFNEVLITENLDNKPTIEIYDDWRE